MAANTLKSPPASVLIVDNDVSVAGAATAVLQASGCGRVLSQGNGNEALPWLEGEAFEMIVLGWKVPGLSGPAFLNKLRAHQRYTTVPVVVVSDEVRPRDFRLLEDFPCTALLEKPFSDARFIRVVDDLIAEKAWYERNKLAVTALFKTIKENPAGAVAAIDKLVASSPSPIPMMLLAADSLLEAGFQMEASDVYRKVLVQDENCLRGLNGLGRALYLMDRGGEAAEFLRVAVRDCPENIHRLCLLGEIELSQLKPDAARRRFQDALAIDPTEKRAVAGLVLSNNLGDHIRRHSGANLPASFASLCNTVGVHLVREGRIEEGIKQYMAALQMLPDEGTSARVSFNVGLAYLRWKNPEEAVKWFKDADAKSGGTLTKAKRYSEQVAQYLKGRAKAGPKQAVPDHEDKFDDAIAAFEADFATDDDEDIFAEEKF